MSLSVKQTETKIMKTFSLYQINKSELRDAMEVAKSWDKGIEMFPVVKAYCDSTFNKHQESFSVGKHLKVAEVQANDLEHVFHLGNVQHDAFTVFNPMHSVSVGDVIENENGEFFMVADCGFEQVFKN